MTASLPRGDLFMPVEIIPLESLKQRIADAVPLYLIDVRSTGEFHRVHARGATSVPLDHLDPLDIAARRGNAGEPIYVICQSGGRAAKACDKLAAAGVSNVYSVEGGTAAWQAAGLPVELGTGGTVSLERQVRIAAGLMVFVGTLLAWLISPWFLIVPGFVGAGLAFSGITNTCGMAMVLAKMPFANKM